MLQMTRMSRDSEHQTARAILIALHRHTDGHQGRCCPREQAELQQSSSRRASPLSCTNPRVTEFLKKHRHLTVMIAETTRQASVRTRGRPRLLHMTGSTPTTGGRGDLMFENNAQAGLLIQMFITYAQTTELACPQNLHSAANTMIDTRRAATHMDRRSSSRAALEEPHLFLRTTR